MTRAHRVNRLIVPILFVVLFLAAAVATAPSGREALSAPDGHGDARQALADGPIVNIHAAGPGRFAALRVRAHLCQPTRGSTTPPSSVSKVALLPELRRSATADDETSAQLPPGTRAADLQFRVGTAVSTWADELGYAHQLTCGAGCPVRSGRANSRSRATTSTPRSTVVYGPTSLFEEPPPRRRPRPPHPTQPSRRRRGRSGGPAHDGSRRWQACGREGGRWVSGRVGSERLDRRAGLNDYLDNDDDVLRRNSADSAGAAGEGGGTGDGGASSDREITAAALFGDRLRGCLARRAGVPSGVAGLVGGALIVLIVVRRTAQDAACRHMVTRASRFGVTAVALEQRSCSQVVAEETTRRRSIRRTPPGRPRRSPRVPPR